MKFKSVLSIALASTMLCAAAAGAAEYTYDPANPYDGLIVGLFNDVPIAAEEQEGIASIYLPEGLQPWAQATIILTPDGVTAAEFAESELGLQWRAFADEAKIGLGILEPADGAWNLELDESGRNDAAILNQLYMTMRSKSKELKAPFTMDKTHTSLIGYQEGGAAALLFGARYATDFSSIVAVDAPAVSAEAFEAVGAQLVIPFAADSTAGIEEMHVEARNVPTPVWFLNSETGAALDFFLAASGAQPAEANEYAENVCIAENEAVQIWVGEGEYTPAEIYAAFLGRTNRFMAMEDGGRVEFTTDMTTDQYIFHEEEINGEPRRWITYVPTSYTGEEAVPVVMAIHGYTASMQSMVEESRWSEVAEEYGFIVLFMQGMVRERDGGNIPAATWVAGAFAPSVHVDDPDIDLKFLNAVLDQTEEEYNIDKSREYVTGHSNGSMMTWEMGAHYTDRIAAIAPIGFTTPADSFDSDALIGVWTMCGEYDSAATPNMIDGNETVKTLRSYNEHNGVDETKLETSEQYDGQWQTMTFPGEGGVPLVRFTNILRTAHIYMPQEARTAWEDFFSHYTRGEDGSLYYDGELVEKQEYVADDAWITPAE